jgi:hypothetical protein
MQSPIRTKSPVSATPKSHLRNRIQRPKPRGSKRRKEGSHRRSQLNKTQDGTADVSLSGGRNNLFVSATNTNTKTGPVHKALVEQLKSLSSMKKPMTPVQAWKHFGKELKE